MVTSEWPTLERPFDVPFLPQQVEFLRRAGVEVDVFAFRGAAKPLNYFRAWKRLRKQLDSGHYDLVHAQFGQSALLPWPKRLPLVVTFHGCDVLGVRRPNGRRTIPGRLLQALCWLIARKANAVIIVSNQMRKYLPDVPMHVLPTGVDLESLPKLTSEQARRQLGLPAAKHLVLFVGNPQDPRKRLALAQQAVELLTRTVPARLIIGWGQPHQNILLLMKACNVLVVTSRQEGSPTIVKEALACDLPVVSVHVGDVAERLQGVEGCELCHDLEPQTIAAALERVLRRDQRIKGCEVMKGLDERVLADRLIGIYRSVMRASSEIGALKRRDAVLWNR